MRPFVVLVVLVLLPSVCAGQQAKTCNVTPKDQYVAYGGDTEVVCQTSCVPGGVYWTLNNGPVDESLSRSVNSSHTVLTLRNFTHRDAALQCHSSRTHQILGGTYIRTYHKPAKLSCVLHYKTYNDTGTPQLLTCHWEHQDAPSNINYTLLYAYVTKPENKAICSSPVTNCTCEGKVSTIVDAWLTVRATTDHWEVDSDRFVFKLYEIMKINRPSVEVTASADRVEVMWHQPVVSRRPLCHCQVRYAKAVNGEILESKVLNQTLKPQQDQGNETLKEVDSCTNYSISVRCALHKAPWSDWSHEETLLTGLDKRHVRLRLWRTISDPGGNETRRVHAAWTEVPPTCRGTFTYALSKTRCGGDAAGLDRAPVPCGRSSCDVDEHAHRIHLSVLENGSLLAEESVYVPASAENLPQVTDIQTSSLQGVIVVKWKAPAQPVSGYVIDWARRGHRFYWKESGCTNTTLSGLLDKKPYDITVTPLFDNKTGHGTQVLQICSRVGDPGNVTVIRVEPNDRTAFVGWKTTSQEECSGDVVTYTVYYGADTGPALNVTVDSARQSINLKELEPGTQYSVYVEAWALTGSTRSSRRLFKTNRFDPRLPLALGVCGSIVIALAFSVGLFCAIQWKKFSEKPVPNPGLSSLQLWSSAGQKEIDSFQPFITPSESLMDRIHTEGPQRTSTSPLATSCSSNLASDRTDAYTDPAVAVAPDVQGERPRERVLCSSGEPTALLPSGSGPVSPYRSQSSVEALTSTTIKQCKRVPAKPLEKTAPATVYVTLDMCDQGQSR